ncbi:cell division protein SepF [Corynebacterium crudilactis]|uniref:Cell division protein SepF n=1 Tax=Corynebacterium crudilactis TaxID=1652495 RepID=A0A172QUL6_9CORY|nr:cell division protein SepF [Corynebacterium crudilactis]ANE04397.1 cell division protein SepF [Corynebacterium crudilactis]
MSMLKKTKEFFGLAPYEAEHEDAYYADEPRYEGTAAYAPEYRERDYGYSPEAPAPAAPAPRSYQSTIVPVELHSFEDAQVIGAAFRDGDAVVFDMGLLSREDARRIVDFAAGLCFALRGKMQKIDSLTFAVVPELSTVSSSELERAARLR